MKTTTRNGLTLALVLAAGAACCCCWWWLTREGCRLVISAHPGGGAVRCLAVSPDGTLLATGGAAADGEVRLWQLPSGSRQRSLEVPKGTVTALAFSPDGATLAVGLGDGTLKVWSLAEPRELFSLRTAHRQGVHALLFAGQARALVSAGGGDRLIRLWEPATGTALGTLADHKVGVAVLALSGDGRWLASGGGGDNVIRLWDLPARQLRHRLKGHTRRVMALAFVGSQRLVSGDRDGAVKLWDMAGGQERASFQAHEERVVGLGGVGAAAAEAFVSVSEDGALARWSLPPAGWPAVAARWRQRRGASGLTLSPDGRWLLTAGRDGCVRLWDVVPP